VAVAHQLVATPGTLVLGFVVVFALIRLGWGHLSTAAFLPSLLTNLLFLGVALAIGYGVSRCFPDSAGLGYWSWALPTIGLLLNIWYEASFLNESLMGELRKLLSPNDVSLEFEFVTVPWLQSFFYSFGLYLGVRFSPVHSDNEDPLTCPR